MRDVSLNSMPEIIPTVVPAKAEDIVTALSRYSFARTLHIDFADGTLAPNTTWLPGTKHDFPQGSLAYEAHLMVAEPLSLGIACARAGISRLIAHVESFSNAERAGDVFALWRSAGVHDIGVALSLSTPPPVLDAYDSLVDFVQLMTIERIGEQGQLFDERAIARVAAVRARHAELTIAVDGGVTTENISALTESGATRFCVGATLARAENPASTYEALLHAVNAVS